MVVVIAAIELREGKRSTFVDEFRKVVPLVRAEDGCIEYMPTLDVDTDIPVQVSDPNQVTIVERWESLDALKAHLAAPHMTAYRERVSEMVVSLTVRVLAPA